MIAAGAPGRPRGIDGAAVGVLTAAAAVFVAVMWQLARGGRLLPSLDTYAFDYSIATYLARAAHQGDGLLWDRFQNCGEPFYASTGVGLLYPLHALSLVLRFDVALLAVMLVHLI